MKTPLEGIRVLDLSHALAGPYCSTMLADYGADVIKIETPGSGDISRAWGSPLPGGETAYFISLHRNKRGVVLDLKHPEGRETFMRLAEKSDVVLENFRIGVLKRLGLGYDAVKARNPGIVYCSISGFGQDGPYRDRAALDLIVQAESGMISVTGSDGGDGARCGVSIADMAAGMNAAYGIMLALRVKEKTGAGQFIDISMLEGQLSLLSTMLGSFLADGQVPRPMGTAYKALLPYQTFRTKTRDLALAVGSEKLWRQFCPLIGMPELASDARYTSNRLRDVNRASLIETLQNVFLTRSYEEWEALFIASGMPVGAINDLSEVVKHPQVKARGVFVDSHHPAAGTVPVVGPAIRLSDTPGGVRTPSPMLGQHTDEILRDVLGLSGETIAAMRKAGVMGAVTTRETNK